MTKGSLTLRRSHLKIQHLALLTVFLYFQFSSVNTAFSQKAEIGLSAGLTNFQGDLPSYNFQDGLQLKLHPEIGLFVRYPVLSAVAVRADLRYTGVSGDDALHDSEGSRRRNLHFRSSIIQGFLAVEVYPVMFFREEPPRLNIFLAGGAGFYHFNPQARYQGQWVELHPLSTEGQGLEAYPEQESYSLTQLQFPLGGGLRFEINDVWSIGAELFVYVLTTDYLDDVSTYYISYAELLEAKGPLSAALANREGEYLGTGPVEVNTGTNRGNPDTKDYFATASLTVHCALDAIFVPRSQRFKKKCPKF